MAKVYYDNDADVGFLKGKTIGVIGYGNQGCAQALNLKDSGLDVIIGVRADETQLQAQSDGFDTFPIEETAQRAQVLLLLIPDEIMPDVFKSQVLPGLSQGKAICFATGYNVAFGFIEPPDGIDVVMVAPRMIGAGVRQRYQEGKGFPSFIGVHQDATGNALNTTLAIARGIGSTKSGAMLLTFAQEAELDLFTEQGFGPAFGQTLLSAIQILIDAGYPEEAVMIELILSGEFAYSMQKIAEIGFFPQMELHSHTSQYGSMTRGARFIIPQIAETMKDVLQEIRSGAFAREWDAEQKAGLPVFNQIKELRDQHPIVKWERATREAFRMD
ncbi:MAG: ketol-acid reductoisomerase [Dehalococcoidia bacterium]|nr:MAG: ketol-acid reductoisomerase [Dehalococcoidia bacterium]